MNTVGGLAFDVPDLDEHVDSHWSLPRSTWPFALTAAKKAPATTTAHHSVLTRLPLGGQGLARHFHSTGEYRLARHAGIAASAPNSCIRSSHEGLGGLCGSCRFFSRLLVREVGAERASPELPSIEARSLDCRGRPGEFQRRGSGATRSSAPLP